MYYVIELQSNGSDGSALPFSFPDEADAKAKAYSLASVAVKSDVVDHTILCVNADGFNVLEPMPFHHEPKPTKKASK